MKEAQLAIKGGEPPFEAPHYPLPTDKARFAGEAVAMVVAETVHAASASVGIATANMLPSFTISGNPGYMNTLLAGLINPANLSVSATRSQAATSSAPAAG